jgi:hypothetical protein
MLFSIFCRERRHRNPDLKPEGEMATATPGIPKKKK